MKQLLCHDVPVILVLRDWLVKCDFVRLFHYLIHLVAEVHSCCSHAEFDGEEHLASALLRAVEGTLSVESSTHFHQAPGSQTGTELASELKLFQPQCSAKNLSYDDSVSAGSSEPESKKTSLHMHISLKLWYT